MTVVSRRISTLLAAAAMALGGCVVTVDDGATVETRGWTINGQDPTPANCDLFEVDEVLLELEDTFNGDLYEVSFACTEGRRVQVVEDFLPVGDYAVFWTAFDAFDGSVVDSVRVTPDVRVRSRGDVVTLDLPLLSRPRFEITWDAAGFTCAQAGVDSVDLELVPEGASGDRILAENLPCSDVGYLFSNVAEGDYTLRVDGFDGAFRAYAGDCPGYRIPTTQGTLFCDGVPKI